VRVTHPFHPKFGQELDVIVRRYSWGEDRVFYRKPAGKLASLPSRWTSVLPEDLLVVVVSAKMRTTCPSSFPSKASGKRRGNATVSTNCRKGTAGAATDSLRLLILKRGWLVIG
jgi:hypothetical protein